MLRLILFVLIACSLTLSINAQVCDPTIAPTGLTSTYTPGSGALLEWMAVPGSVGMQLRVILPSGAIILKRTGSFELDHFLIPDDVLSAGDYSWRVQASCSTTPPYNVTPVSVSRSFTVGGATTCPATVTDIDGNVYTTTEIGDQCWTAQNLKVEHYNNGDPIPTGLSDIAWSNTYMDSTGAFAVYNNVAANKAIYGLLYNWYAVGDDRGLCPAGWSAGKDPEWTDMRVFLGGRTEAGGKMKATGTLGAGTGYWQAPNHDATNSSGFSALPGGLRELDGTYAEKGYKGYWWSSGQFFDSGGSWYRELFYNSGFADRDFVAKETGYSVRCLQD